MLAAAGKDGSGVLAPLARRLEAEQERWFGWLPVFSRLRHRALLRLAARAVGADRAGATCHDGRLARGRRGACDAHNTTHSCAARRGSRLRARQAARRMGAGAGADQTDERRRGARLRRAHRAASERAVSGSRCASHRSAIFLTRQRPARVRVTTNRALPGLQPGSAVRLRATLMPPSEPALPGDYDFGRQAWFAGIGAVGYSLSAPTIEAGAPERADRPAPVGGGAARAPGDRRAHRRGAAGRDRRHRHRADHRRARRHLGRD